jgi:hypothetical protein
MPSLSNGYQIWYTENNVIIKARLSTIRETGRKSMDLKWEIMKR